MSDSDPLSKPVGSGNSDFPAIRRRREEQPSPRLVSLSLSLSVCLSLSERPVHTAYPSTPAVTAQPPPRPSPHACSWRRRTSRPAAESLVEPSASRTGSRVSSSMATGICYFPKAIGIKRPHVLPLRPPGGPMSRILTSLHQNKVSGQVLPGVMACSSIRSLADPEVEGGVVLPALEVNAQGAISAIKSGKVIAVPTDTLYGFACDACSADAIKRIYAIKGRQETKPLAICVADVLEISRFAITEHLPHGLLDNLLPGPVTIVLRRGDASALETSLNPSLDSIGVRVPDSEFIRTVARGSGSALALTSANLSGHPSSISVKDFENLWQHCAFVYDGGLLSSGRAGSTVVDLTVPGKYVIIRAGSARKETSEILQRFCLVEEEEEAPSGASNPLFDDRTKS